MTEQSNALKGVRLWIVLPLILIIAGAILTYLLLKTPAEESDVEEEPRILEYTDKEYGYSFQFPSNWRMEKAPQGSEISEIRVLLQGPRGSSVIAVVGQVEKSMTKEEFDGSPDKSKIVEQMIDLSIDQIYKNTATDIGATRMVVAKKEVLPSEVSIQFYVSTFDYVDSATQVAVTGIHAVPFGENHMISFLANNVLSDSAEEESQTVSLILGSFHLLSEKPRE